MFGGKTSHPAQADLASDQIYPPRAGTSERVVGESATRKPYSGHPSSKYNGWSYIIGTGSSHICLHDSNKAGTSTFGDDADSPSRLLLLYSGCDHCGVIPTLQQRTQLLIWPLRPAGMSILRAEFRLIETAWVTV